MKGLWTMLYIANAFSCQMVPEHLVCAIRQIPLGAAVAIIHNGYTLGGGVESIVGHPDVAAVIQDDIRSCLSGEGITVVANRKSVVLEFSDLVLIGQYNGGRLPEGTKVLPAGASITWYLAEMHLRDRIPSVRY